MNIWLLLIGALQGLSLAALWELSEGNFASIAYPVASRACLYAAFALAFAIYFTASIESLSKARRVKILIFTAIYFPILGAYSGWAEQLMYIEPFTYFWLFPASINYVYLFAAGLLGVLSLPLLIHFNFVTKSLDYPQVFETLFRNTVITIFAIILTALLWAMLIPCAILLNNIRFEVFTQLLIRPSVIALITCCGFSAAFALGLSIFKTNTVRKLFTSNSFIFFLVLILGLAIFVIFTLPFDSKGAPLQNKEIAVGILCFFGVIIILINIFYQDNERAPSLSKYLTHAFKFFWISTIIFVSISWLAVSKSISQHGILESGVWMIFFLIVASIFVIGYSRSMLAQNGWLSTIGQTNIVATVTASFGLLLLLSPVADPRRLAANNQLHRLKAGIVEPKNFDYDYLQRQTGYYGQQALSKLLHSTNEEDSELLAKVRQAIMNNNFRDSNMSPPLEELPDPYTNWELREP